MTAQVPKSTQLQTFSVVRNILLTSATLNKKFTINDYYELEPKVKSPAFNGYPFIIIEIPEREDLLEYVGGLTTEIEFVVTITMVNEYGARSNISSLASSILSTLDSAASTLRSFGYDMKSINLIGKPEPTTLQQKDVVITEFELTLDGEVKI